MGWQERDWAKWTDAERARMLGTSTVACRKTVRERGAEVTLAALVVGALVSLVAGRLGLFSVPHLGSSPVRPPAQPAVVYGTGVVRPGPAGEELTCTALAMDARHAVSCTTWNILAPGQRAERAGTQTAPPPGCIAVVADQATGRWRCTQGDPAGYAGA